MASIDSVRMVLMQSASMSGALGWAAMVIGFHPSDGETPVVSRSRPGPGVRPIRREAVAHSSPSGALTWRGGGDSPGVPTARADHAAHSAERRVIHSAGGELDSRADRRVAELAAEQSGVVSVRELCGCGLSL